MSATLNKVVKNVREKFSQIIDNVKEKFEVQEGKTENMEAKLEAVNKKIKKLADKMMKIQNRVAMNSETAGEASINDAVLAQMNAEFMAREQKLLERIERLDAAYGEVKNSLKLVQT